MKKDFKAFTLAETLIVVAILGVVAVITIPNLIKNQIEAQNRTKVKKAMSVYERALSKMAIENELKTDNMINSWANEEANCGNTFKYFKASQGQECMFKTSDGVWWDITNILRPMIYLKREGINSNNKETVTGYAKDPNNKEAFILVGRFEDAISALRINDKAFEDSHTVTNDDDFDGTSTKAKLEKLYGFMGTYTKKENLPDNFGAIDWLETITGARLQQNPSYIITTDSSGRVVSAQSAQQYWTQGRQNHYTVVYDDENKTFTITEMFFNRGNPITTRKTYKYDGTLLENP